MSRLSMKQKRLSYKNDGIEEYQFYKTELKRRKKEEQVEENARSQQELRKMSSLTLKEGGRE